MIILAGIGIYGSTDIIKKAKLEEMETNMLLIEAKAREYVESATFKMGINPDEPKKQNVRNTVYVEEAKLQKATDADIPSSFGIITSNKINEIREDIMQKIVDIEASIDYPEYDIEEITKGELRKMLERVNNVGKDSQIRKVKQVDQ